MASADDVDNLLPRALERTLPDDAAEYIIIVPEDRPRARLDQVRKAALQLADDLTKNYIWQRDAFNLDIVSRGPGLLCLRGLTSYGDCVEDEWLIVYILRELTKSFPDVWVRIADSDGEFLLAEAANAVPAWLNPENDAHRVWIHRGELLVIPLDAKSAPALTLADAVRVIKTTTTATATATTPSALVRIPALEAEAFFRLKKYPGHVAASLYHTRLILPRKIAFLLHDRPRAVAPAVEAFVARDPITTKKVFDSGAAKALQFPPTDLVVISVKLTRVLYAQLRGQRFTPPAGWPAAFGAFAEQRVLLADEAQERGKGKGKATSAAAAASGDNDLERHQNMIDVGMKLTCGFELLAATVDTSNNRIVREMGIILQDLVADDDDGDDDNSATAALPTDAEMRAWKNADREDDDAWLNIDLDDFERELERGRDDKKEQTKDAPPATTPKQPEPASQGAGFGDARVQTDLRRIVSQFQAFLNDNDAGIEGAEFDEMDNDDDDEEDDDDDDDDETDDDVDFDEEKFNRLMREMMGLPPDETSTSSATEPSAKAKTADGDDDDEEGILKLAAQFEAELKGHGALKLNPAAPKGEGSQAVAGKQPSTADDAQDVDSDDDGEVDVDLNLAKNLLESFKGQEGMAGPAGNILSMLGMTLPRDDDEADKT